MDIPFILDAYLISPGVSFGNAELLVQKKHRYVLKLIEVDNINFSSIPFINIYRRLEKDQFWSEEKRLFTKKKTTVILFYTST